MSPVDRPLRMPAEWEPHRATWISWPHHEPDWPGKLGAIPWVYAEIARLLARHEPVEILCASDAVVAEARVCLEAHAVRTDAVRLHVVPTDRVWLRDSAPTGVFDAHGRVVLRGLGVQRLGEVRQLAPRRGRRSRRRARHRPRARGADAARTDAASCSRAAASKPTVAASCIVTEEWLLSDVQVRNPGLGREDYDAIFAEWLGARRTIWLGEGCVGDDTHGHIDDVARFVSADTVVLAVEPDPADENHERSMDNVRRLELAARDPGVGPLRVVHLPYPRALYMHDERLPASYANFYVANGVVIVPTFNDPNDRVALGTLANLFPGREVVGIHAGDLVWGQGTLHCLTQQEPLVRRSLGGGGSGWRG